MEIAAKDSASQSYSNCKLIKNFFKMEGNCYVILNRQRRTHKLLEDEITN
jgi:hypothetical protein